MAKTLRDPKRRPTHPGEILREDVLPTLGLTQKEFADNLGVSRLTVSEILREKRGVTPDMAIRLGKLLGNGPEIWLRMQQSVDIWALEQRGGYECIEQLQAA
jgi:addiction module HigA family antidote